MAVLKQTKSWKNFSKWGRQKDSSCYTCGARGDYRESDFGHFFHNCSFHFFNPVFVRRQCVRCNRFLHGNLGVYARKLIEEIGLEKLKQAEKDKVKYKKWKPSELKEIEIKYVDK